MTVAELVPLKHVAGINLRKLGEDTDPDLEIRYIDIGSVGRGALVDEPATMTFSAAPSRARRVVQSGDTIVSTVRTYLRAVLPIRGRTEGLVASTGFAVITPRLIEPAFMAWYLQSDTFIEEVVARSVGVSYPAINPAEIGEMPVPLPAAATQRAIAHFLDSETARLDALVERKLELLASARLRSQAFATEVTRAEDIVRVNSGGTAAVDWSTLQLRRCFREVLYGTGEASRPEGPIAVLGMGNVDDDGRVAGPPGGFVEYVDEALLLQEGDLLFNRTNSLAKVGKVGLVRRLEGPTTAASYLVVMRCSSLANAAYLNYALNTPPVLDLVRTMALPSIGQANLNPSRYSALRVVLPSREDQSDIVGRLDAAFARVSAVEIRLTKQITLLQEHRQALITAAVTGELQIPQVAA